MRVLKKSKKKKLIIWLCDSAATADYNVGCPPDRRTIQVLEKNGIKGYKHRARLITDEDFNKFDMIFGMDHANISDLEDLKPRGRCHSRLHLLGEWDPNKETIIKDPYFLPGMEPFDEVFAQCMRCITAYLCASSNWGVWSV